MWFYHFHCFFPPIKPALTFLVDSFVKKKKNPPKKIYSYRLAPFIFHNENRLLFLLQPFSSCGFCCGYSSAARQSVSLPGSLSVPTAALTCWGSLSLWLSLTSPRISFASHGSWRRRLNDCILPPAEYGRLPASNAFINIYGRFSLNYRDLLIVSMGGHLKCIKYVFFYWHCCRPMNDFEDNV